MPDLNHSITQHNDEVQSWFRHPRHIAARKEQIKKHPFCSRCGRKATLILHEYPDDYRHGFEHYVGLIERGNARPAAPPAISRRKKE